MNKKVIVAGHICLDITPLFPPQKGMKVSDILLPGKLIEMEGVNVNTGGAVANTGLAMKLLGVDVSLMGKVGNDTFGEMILNILKKYDANISCFLDNDPTYQTKQSLLLIKNRKPYPPCIAVKCRRH